MPIYAFVESYAKVKAAAIDALENQLSIHSSKLS